MHVRRWTTPLAAVGLTLTSMLTPTAAFASTPIHVGQDPYATGCAKGAYIANSFNFLAPDTGVVLAKVENWFSPACDTNWALMTWTGDNAFSWIKIYTGQNGPSGTEGTHLQCFPDNASCFGQYTGSPDMWTNMIEGTDLACIQASHFDGLKADAENVATDVACA